MKKKWFVCGWRANLRSDFEGELPYSGGTMDPSKRKAASGSNTALTAGETKTSLMRQEMHSGKSGKNKWSWKEREDDMRELERRSLEQKREIQKLKKVNETSKEELDELKEKVSTTENEIAQIIATGKYKDNQGNTYVFLQDTVVKQQEDDVAILKSQIEKLESENGSLKETLKTSEEEKHSLAEQLVKLASDKEALEASILEFSNYKETANASITRLRKVNETTDASIIHLTEDKEKTDASIVRLTKEKETSDALITQLTEEKQDAGATITQLTNDKAIADASLTQLLEEKEAAHESIAELTKEKQTSEATIAELTKDHTRLAEEKAKADDTITRLTNDKQTADATIPQLTNEKAIADASLTQLLDEKEAAHGSIAELTKEKQTSEATIAELTKDKTRLTEEKEKSDETISQLTNDKQTADATITQLTQDKSTANDSITQLLEDKEAALASITTLTKDKEAAEDSITQLRKDKEIADASITQFLKDQETTNATISQLSEDKDLLISSKFETEANIEIQKLEFEESTKDFENKLDGKEKEISKIEDERKDLSNKLNEITEAKEILQLDIDEKSSFLEDQLKKIEDLTKTLLARDSDLKEALQELDKSREECKLLQESNNCIENEQEMFMTEILMKLDEIMKILQDVQYVKKPEDVTNYPGSLREKIPEIIINHNEDNLDEELNRSSDSSDRLSIKSNSDWIIPKFEELKNLLLQKIGDIDNLLSDKDFQINKSTFQLEEYKVNCDNIKEEANTMKQNFEGMLELKGKEIQEVRDENENIKSEYGNTKVELEQIQQSQIAGLENSDAYHREQVDAMKNNMEKISKDHEAVLTEANKNMEALKGQLNYLRNDIVLKDKEFADLSRKHESSISQVNEREKELREEHETYLTEEVTRLQNEWKGKLVEIKEEHENNITRLTQEYEDKITDVEVAYEKLKSNESETLHDDYTRQLDAVSAHCRQLIDERNGMENLLNASKSVLEQELQNVKESLVAKITELDLLQAKYDAQHRLIDLVTSSLEQERAKKSDSNSEILTILEKLDKQFSETFSASNELLYASKNSMNSLLSESLPDSLHSNQNPQEFNTTWPPKFKKTSSPIRRWASLGTLEQDQEKRKELIERLRTEISIQLNGISDFSPPQKPYLTKPQMSWSNGMDAPDGGEHLSAFDHRSSMLSKFDHRSPTLSIFDHRSPTLPNNTHDRAISPTLSLRTRLLKNKISLDSGLDQHEDNELISYPNQIHNVTQMFLKLEEQHDRLKQDSLGALDKQWSVELDNWKNRVQYKLTDLQPPPSEKDSSIISSVGTSAIIFHPDDNEVKAIIENTNKMYDNSQFFLS